MGVNPKIWGKFPLNYPFVHRVFHYFHHPFWGPIPIYGNIQMCVVVQMICLDPMALIRLKSCILAILIPGSRAACLEGGFLLLKKKRNQMCQGLNSHYFHIIGDGHQPNSRGLYTHYNYYKDSY